MKRWMLFLLAALVLAALFSTCGPTPAPPEGVIETSGPKPTETVVPTTGEVGQEEISFWTWASTPFEGDAVQQMVQQFGENTGIAVDLLVIQ